VLLLPLANVLGHMRVRVCAMLMDVCVCVFVRLLGFIQQSLRSIGNGSGWTIPLWILNTFATEELEHRRRPPDDSDHNEDPTKIKSSED
jgi:hypothetical protein